MEFKKTINKEIICAIGTLSAIVLFIVTCVFQIKNGYARDIGIYVFPIISISLWILLGVCIIFILVFWAINKLPTKKLRENRSGLTNYFNRRWFRCQHRMDNII